MKNPLGKQESDARALTEQIEEEAERLARQVSAGSEAANLGVTANPEVTANSGVAVNPGAVGERVLGQEMGVGVVPEMNGRDRVDLTTRQLGQTVAETAYADRVDDDLARGNLEEQRVNLEALGEAGLDLVERDALAGAELARDEIALNDPLAVVGVDTPGQAEQRIKEDLADLRTEDGTGLALENQVTKQATTKIVQEVANAADDLMRQRSFRVKDLENLYRTESEKERRIFGRPLGSRN